MCVWGLCIFALLCGCPERTSIKCHGAFEASSISSIFPVPLNIVCEYFGRVTVPRGPPLFPCLYPTLSGPDCSKCRVACQTQFGMVWGGGGAAHALAARLPTCSRGKGVKRGVA